MYKLIIRKTYGEIVTILSADNILDIAAIYKKWFYRAGRNGLKLTLIAD